MELKNSLNNKQVVVLVPFEELKEDLLNAVRQEIQGLKIEPAAKIESKSKFYSPVEVRELFQISRSTLHNWKHQGLLVPKKIGGKVLFERNAVERIINAKNAK